MAQKRVRVHCSAAQWAALDETIGVMERGGWEPMIVVLPPGGRIRTKKMGDRSEPLCRGAHRAMQENPCLVPHGLDLDEMARGRASHDALAQRRIRVERLVEKLIETDIALGGDIMAAALHGYVHLKLGSRAHGLQGLCDELGKPVAKRGRRSRATTSRTA